MTATGLERAVLAISAFRSDDAVIKLLSSAFDDRAPRFGRVIIVDSLGSGKIAETAASEGWPIEYYNASSNLGSAGNLDRRLRLAAETGLDWCLALNHDAELSTEKAIKLLGCGSSGRRVGAVFPTLRMTSAGGRLDKPRRKFITFGLLTDLSESEAFAEVSWSSSNGALYRLDAIRDGVSAWPQLWMGYEDLAIGWELRHRGWRQILCRDVVVDDNYEFKPIRVFGRSIHIADKPVWYSYYQLRNLALIAKGTRGKALGWGGVARRGIIDFLLLAFRQQKVQRARLLIKGLIDGLLGVDGIGEVNR